MPKLSGQLVLFSLEIFVNHCNYVIFSCNQPFEKNVQLLTGQKLSWGQLR